MRAIIFGVAILSVISSAAQDPIIFFPGDFQEKVAEIPTSSTAVEKPSGPAGVVVDVDYGEVVTPVSRYVFGNNANIYMTQMIDQPVLLDNIRGLSPNVIRFPGGNLSSVFFWNADAHQPPADAPSKLVDANGVEVDPGYWYGKNQESWTLSVDNYYAMLEATTSTGILTVNYGYARYGMADDPVAAAAHLAAEWVRYDQGRTKFWEIGNESNGSWQAGFRINPAGNMDGQPEIVSGALYGRHFKVFADSMRKAAAEIQHTIFIGAQLLAEAPADWWNDTDRNWNAGVFSEAGAEPDFYIIHSYYTPYQVNSTAADILNSATTVTRDLISFVSASVSAAGLPAKPVALTEWNIFAEGSQQQVSFINGMHAAIVAGELVANRYGMACRWDFANAWENGNDHGMFSQGDQPGVPKWHPRPAYFYLYYFQKYFGDRMLEVRVSGASDVLAYASRFSSGEVGVVVINKGNTSHNLSVNVGGYGYGDKFYFHSLTGGNDNGEFSLRVFVNDKGPSYPAGGPDTHSVLPRSSSVAGGVRLHASPRSVQYILIEKGDNVITGTVRGEPSDIRIFPNPAKKNLKVEVPSARYARLEIRNSQGMLIRETTIAERATTLELNIGLAPGIYTLLFYSEGAVCQKKVLIY